MAESRSAKTRPLRLAGVDARTSLSQQSLRIDDGHSTSLLGQLNLQRGDHAYCDVAGVVDAADVDDDNFEALVHRADFADRRFGTGEERSPCSS